MLHYTAVASATAGGVFVLNNFLTYIFELPGLYGFLNQFGANLDFPTKDYSVLALILGFFQSVMYVAALAWPAYVIFKLDGKPRNSKVMNLAAELVISAAFWSVMLVGIADAAISFVRIENLLPAIVGDDLALSLGKPSYRGIYVHIP